MLRLMAGSRSVHCFEDCRGVRVEVPFWCRVRLVKIQYSASWSAWHSCFTRRCNERHRPSSDGDPEVRDKGVAALIDQDVCRLHVSVDDFPLVGIMRCLCNLGGDADGRLDGQSPAQQVPAQIRSVDEASNDEAPAPVCSHVMNGDDAGMPKLCRPPCLAGRPQVVFQSRGPTCQGDFYGHWPT